MYVLFKVSLYRIYSRPMSLHSLQPERNTDQV